MQDAAARLPSLPIHLKVCICLFLTFSLESAWLQNALNVCKKENAGRTTSFYASSYFSAQLCIFCTASQQNNLWWHCRTISKGLFRLRVKAYSTLSLKLTYKGAYFWCINPHCISSEGEARQKTEVALVSFRRCALITAIVLCSFWSLTALTTPSCSLHLRAICQPYA